MFFNILAKESIKEEYQYGTMETQPNESKRKKRHRGNLIKFNVRLCACFMLQNIRRVRITSFRPEQILQTAHTHTPNGTECKFASLFALKSEMKINRKRIQNSCAYFSSSSCFVVVLVVAVFFTSLFVRVGLLGKAVFVEHVQPFDKNFDKSLARRALDLCCVSCTIENPTIRSNIWISQFQLHCPPTF